MNLNNQRQLFLDSRMEPSQDLSEYEEERDLFESAKQEDDPIIPPIGIAEPGLVQKSLETVGKPQELREYITELERYKKESPLETTGRNVAANSVRGLEGLGGFWGNIQELMTSLTGVNLPERDTKREKGSYAFSSFGGEEGPDLFKSRSATTKELRELTKKSTGEYLEPKTDAEKAGQEISEEIGGMFAVPGGLSNIQKMLIPVFGQTSKEVVKKFGGSEKEQDMAKLATMGLASFAQLGNAPRVAREALNAAEQMIPRGLRFTAQPTQRALNQIRNSQWYRSGVTPQKQAAFGLIERIENQIQNGFIDGRMAMQLRRDINEIRRNMGGFLVPFKADRTASLNYINQVDRALLDSMENYGTRVNPRWWNNYNLANEAFRITQRSQALSEFIHNSGGKKLISEAGKYLLAPALTISASTVPVVGAGIATGIAGMKTIQILNRVVRSPILRRHYADVLRVAATGNANATRKALEQFDIAAKNEEDQSPKKISPNQ